MQKSSLFKSELSLYHHIFSLIQIKTLHNSNEAWVESIRVSNIYKHVFPKDKLSQLLWNNQDTQMIQVMNTKFQMASSAFNDKKTRKLI